MTWFRLLLLSLVIFCLSLLQLSSQIKVYSKRNTGWGLNLLKDFDKLHHLRTGMISFKESSQDITGGNNDAIGNYLYKDGDEYIAAEVEGSGVITRIWTTDYAVDDSINRIRIYLDGKSEPVINESIKSFFEGKNSYLPFPICANSFESTGGYFCYVNFPFRESMKVTFTDDKYFQVDFYKFNPWIPVPEFKIKSNYEDEIKLWNSNGKDPKEKNYKYYENVINAPSGKRTEIANLTNGKKTVGQFFLKIPKIEFHPRITDDGISFGKASSFKMNINPLHDKIILKRRLDYGIGDQKAAVYVDGNKSGEWFTPGIDSLDRWRDSEYEIDPIFTKGKKEIIVRVEFISSTIDWNEFRYWIYSDDEITDSLDIGNSESEKSHDYNVEVKLWEGSRNYQYDGADSASLHIIDSVFLQIQWDDMKYPAVNAPLAMAFGGGMGDPVKFKSFPAGVNDSNEYYCFFPMPYEKKMTVYLDNLSSYDLEDIWVEIGYYNDTVPMEDLGYFHAEFNKSTPTVPLEDHILFYASGTGHYVGLTLEGSDSWGSYLEGDERFYTEGAASPFITGTGTEDYFNCGFHYMYGHVIMPFHGFTINYFQLRAQYRWHILDPIPFYSRARFGFEHGPVNYAPANYYSTAFYYLNPQKTAVYSDSLDIGSSDEYSHTYSIKVSSSPKELESSYTGEKSHVLLKKTGRYHNSESSFNMKILPENSGVFLMRTLDYGNLNQEADVYVDGEFAGKWLNAGSNTFSRWRDDIFIISPAHTYGKSEINIKIDARKSPSPWSEFFYKTLCLTDADTMTIDTSSSDTTNDTTTVVYQKNSAAFSSLMPNPSENEIFLEFKTEKSFFGEILISASDGRVLRRFAREHFNIGTVRKRIDVSNLPAGAYFLHLKKDGKKYFSHKFIIRR